MNSTSCRGWKNTICWHSIAPYDIDQHYCSSCLSKSDVDYTRTRMKVLQDSDISIEDIKSFFDPPIVRCIQHSGPDSCLEEILIYLYNQPKGRVFYLQTYLSILQDTPSLYSHLLLRIRNHTGGSICKVYLWMILHLNDMQWILPERCLRCCMNTGLYCEDYHRKLHTWIGSPPFQNLLLSTLTIHADGVERVFHFYSSVSSYWKGSLLTLQECIRRAFHARYSGSIIEYERFQTSIHRFPPLYPTGPLRTSYREFLRERIDVYKEELIIRTWHPSRFMKWCMDIEELGECNFLVDNPFTP